VTPRGTTVATIRTRSSVALVLGALLLAACGVPLPGGPPPEPVEPPRTGADVNTLVPADEGTAALTVQLLRVSDRAAEVREVLDAVIAAATDPAADPADPSAFRILGEEAVGLLLGEPAGGTGPGLLPAIQPDRGGTSTDDLLTELITFAGDVGGERSRLVLELIRDPLLGDLGAWQRDPVGVIALLRAIAAELVSVGTDPSTLDAAILEIPGELTRTLGYALVVSTTDDPRIARHAAERSSGHLGVVLVALELAVEQLGVR